MKRLSLEEKEWNIVRAKKSFENKQKRKNKLWGGSYIRQQSSVAKFVLTYSGEVEKFCKINNLSQWGKKTQTAIRIDKKTNLFDNPEKLIRVLLDIFYNARHYSQFPTIIFEGRIQFGSLYLMDNMCWEVARSRKWGFKFQDMHIEDQELYSKLRSFFSSTYENENVYLLNEKVIVNRSKDRLANQQYKTKSKEITDMVIRGVRESSNPEFNLSPEGYQAISSTIGEHFDNIILHAPEAEFGYLCGFYDKTAKEVHILIFNFGSTIADTLSSVNLPEQIQTEINTVIESHTKNKFISLFSESFTKENVLTLLSLQEGISSRINFDKSRGHGITDYIEHCCNLNSNSKIALISGSTAIKIDKQYQISKKYFIDRERRVIAFNKDNDLFDKPDGDYVRNMSVYFPGLIIQTIIPLTV